MELKKRQNVIEGFCLCNCIMSLNMYFTCFHSHSCDRDTDCITSCIVCCHCDYVATVFLQPCYDVIGWAFSAGRAIDAGANFVITLKT